MISYRKDLMRMPKYYIPKRKFKIVTYEEIKPYVDLAYDRDMKFCIALTWLTGARIQEIINLTKDNVRVDLEKRDITFYIDALKFGKIGYPTFGFNVPFIKTLIIPHIIKRKKKLLSRRKRRYQQILQELNEKIHDGDKTKWITFHYLRHSRLTYLARVLRAYPEEFKSWTGHKSTAFEEYFAPRRVERFKDLIE